MFRCEFATKDGTSVVFREPTESDAKPMMKFINSVIRETRSGIIMDKPVSLKQEEDWLRARLREIRGRTEVMLVAEAQAGIVGNCDIIRRPWKERHRADVGVVLSKDVRGKGIGRGIMTESMNLALRRMPGLEFFELGALGYNKPAMSLYESLGFVERCRIPDAAKEGDVHVDELVMNLRVKDWMKSKAGKAGKAVRK